MVSVRVLRQQEELDTRRKRLEMARRVGSELGVASARRYAEQKQLQTEAVHHVLQSKWSAQQRGQMSLLKEMASIGEQRQGEGMRNASQFQASAYIMCRSEADAWEAERELEAQRYAVAAERERLDRERRDVRDAAAAHRREVAKQLERERTQRILLRGSVNASNTVSVLPPPLALGLLASQPCRGDRPSLSVSVVSNASPPHVSGKDGAAYFEERKAIEDRERQQRVRDDQRKAAMRAKQVVQEMKQAEEQRRLEEEQESLLKQTMAANAMRSALRPVAATDFQEQESRRAAASLRRSEVEFERQFLAGPWSLDTVARSHVALRPHPNPNHGDNYHGDVFDVCPVDVLVDHTPLTSAVSLLARPAMVLDCNCNDVQADLFSVPHSQRSAETGAHVAFATGLLPFQGIHQQVRAGYNQQESIHDLSVDGDPMPTRDDELPEPTPKSQAPKTPQPAIDGAPAAGTLVGTDASPDTFGSDSQRVPPADGAIPLSPPCDDTHTTTAATTPLRLHQEQFLKDLEMLQQRLAAASSSGGRVVPTSRRADVDVDSSSSSSSELPAGGAAGEADLSISSMSSQELSTKVAYDHSHGSSESSLDHPSAAAAFLARHRQQQKGMSAEELKSSLRALTRKWATSGSAGATPDQR